MVSQIKELIHIGRRERREGKNQFSFIFGSVLLSHLLYTRTIADNDASEDAAPIPGVKGEGKLFLFSLKLG